MNRYFRATAGIYVLILIVLLPVPLQAAMYNASSGVTAIAAGASGEVYIRWTGLPNPGPCGPNNGWVMIPSNANEAIKSLAISLYFSGKPASIDTSGCVGAYESVRTIYSPGG